MIFKERLQNLGEKKDNQTRYTAIKCQNNVHSVICFRVKKIVCTLK